MSPLVVTGCVAPQGTDTTTCTATVDGVPYDATRTVYNMGADTEPVFKYEIDGFPPCSGPAQCEAMIRASDRHKQRLEERRRAQASGTTSSGPDPSETQSGD
jgi:hypothetical protein